MTDWTAERKLKATNMWAMGFTARYIAADLGGLTRNAVLGLLYRLNAPRPTRQRTSRHERAPAEQRRDKGVKQRLQQIIADDRKVDADGLCDLPADQSPFACDFWGLTSTSCRWPLSGDGIDISYCGAERDSLYGPWCARHHKLAYKPKGRSTGLPNVNKGELHVGR